jgi:pimeloyl-ACP methyl ester carboxylesterase
MTRHPPMLSWFAVALLALGACAAALAEEGPLFRFTEQAGPHPVGLKVVEQYDYSRAFRHATDALGRPYKGERARPLQTLIWYPAQRSSGKPMRVSDYLDLLPAETQFDDPQIADRAQEWRASMRPTFETSLWAVRDAPLAPGRFPVVIYAPSFSFTSWENADLCEYLASFGYVVIASPDMGAATRNMTTDLAGIGAQARDISFLIGYASSLANTDVAEVAVAGFSWGGISNLFAAARDNRIDALVALDGSMRYYPGLVRDAGDVHPEEMTIPLIYFAQGQWSLEEEGRFVPPEYTSAPNVLNAWTHGDLITARMLGLTHSGHSSMQQRSEYMWQDFPQWQIADYGRKDATVAYGWVARYTRAFLDAYLKHDATALAFLKKPPAENGVPQHVMAVSYRAGVGSPASFEGFRREIGRQGFDRAADIYATLQKEKPDFKLTAVDLESWAEELMRGKHLREAVTLLQLGLKMYPESGALYERLGDAYSKSGEKQRAIESYRMSLEKLPLITATRQRKIEALERGR